MISFLPIGDRMRSRVRYLATRNEVLPPVALSDLQADGVKTYLEVL